MATYKISPAKEFEYELSLITDERYFELAARALYKAPDYFYFVPASSSGKYHPKSSLGMGGLVRHVKSVFLIAHELTSNPTVQNMLVGDERMQILVACLLHDCLKQGVAGAEAEGVHTVHDHPVLIREHLKPDMEEGMEGAWDAICTIIESHMGSWNVDSKGKSDVVLPIPQTFPQILVHMCDYLASRSIIEVDVNKRSEQLGYKPPEAKWKSEPATDSMLVYLLKLHVEAVSKGIRDVGGKLEGRSFTKGEAGDLIDSLKAKLGKV